MYLYICTIQRNILNVCVYRVAGLAAVGVCVYPAPEAHTVSKQ